MKANIAKSYLQLLHPIEPDGAFPKVPEVDCDNCRRVKEGTASLDVRCCDVIPRFPNFLIGEILETEQTLEQGPKLIREWIAQHRGDPFYMQVPPTLSKQHREARKDGHFGLPCPFLIPKQGRCSIYQMRPVLCFTYHCYYPNGLWKEAWACMQATLELQQYTASHYLVAQSDLNMKTLSAFWSQEEQEDIWEHHSHLPEVYEALWQHKQGQEEQYYRECYQRFCSFSEKDFVDMRKQQTIFLMERLSASEKLSKKKERELMADYHATEAPKPRQPTTGQRRQYRKSYLPAEENELTLRQQESILMWYLQELNAPTLWERIAKLWR